jgi:hypothetical protein
MAVLEVEKPLPEEDDHMSWGVTLRTSITNARCILL